jgi:hypothetical protein
MFDLGVSDGSNAANCKQCSYLFLQSCYLANIFLIVTVLGNLSHTKVILQTDLPCTGRACPLHGRTRLRCTHIVRRAARTPAKGLLLSITLTAHHKQNYATKTISVTYLYKHFFVKIFFYTGLIPPLLPIHCVSCVARINSGIPIDNEL